MNSLASRQLRWVLVPITFGGWFLLAGCADSGDRSSIQQRQNAALNDPMNYGPRPSDPGSDVPTVTGGSTSQLDKPGLRRDLQKVFNP